MEAAQGSCGESQVSRPGGIARAQVVREWPAGHAWIQHSAVVGRTVERPGSGDAGMRGAQPLGDLARNPLEALDGFRSFVDFGEHRQVTALCVGVETKDMAQARPVADRCNHVFERGRRSRGRVRRGHEAADISRVRKRDKLRELSVQRRDLDACSAFRNAGGKLSERSGDTEMNGMSQ